MAEDDIPGEVDVLIELQAEAGVAQKRGELALANLDRLVAQVLTVDLEQVEAYRNTLPSARR
jgi:hypothetical protein